MKKFIGSAVSQTKPLFLGAWLLAGTLQASAFETPVIGDHAEYEVTSSMPGRTQDEKSLWYYDLIAKPSAQTFLQQVTIFQGEGQQRFSQEVRLETLYSSSLIESVLTNCALAGGTPDVLSSPLGQFKTCIIRQDDGEEINRTWIARVPFGMLRREVFSRSDRSNAILELVRFRSVATPTQLIRSN